MKLERRMEKVNKVRRQGLVPGVLFGKDIDSIPVQAENADFMQTYKKYGRTKTFKVKFANKTHQVYFKDIQLNMANPKEVLHFGLLKVTAKDTITAEIPIQLLGQHEIEKQSLIVQQILYSLEVEYPATLSLDRIELDVSHLQLGEGVYVKDIKLPEKFKTNQDGEEMVANVTYPKVQKVEELEEAEGDETVEGEEQKESNENKE